MILFASFRFRWGFPRPCCPICAWRPLSSSLAILCSQVSEKKSHVLRLVTQQESFWGLTLLTVLKPFLTNIKKYSVIEESQGSQKLTYNIYHVSSAIPPRNLIVRGCYVLEMVPFRLEVVTSSIQLAIVSGQVTTIYVHGYIQDQDQDHDHENNRDHDHKGDHDPDDDHDDDPDNV